MIRRAVHAGAIARDVLQATRSPSAANSYSVLVFNQINRKLL